jgi:hypothetical protein
MAKVKVQDGISMRDGKPEFWASWTPALREAYKAQVLNSFKREGLDLEKIVCDAFREWRREHPTKRERYERRVVGEMMRQAVAELMAKKKAEKDAKRPIMRGDLDRELRRRGIR